MASGRRYFILKNPLPVEEIPNLLGRVVVEKSEPTHSCAPSLSTKNNEPAHNPEDIIPDFRPTPVIWSNRKDFFTQTRDWTIQTGLAKVLGIENTFEHNTGVSLHSDTLKCYALSDTPGKFKTLMQNDLFNRDVRDYLNDNRGKQAYFVSGLLTAEGALWTEFSVKSRRSGVDITVPVLDAIGTPPVGVGSPQIAPGFGRSQTYSRIMRIEDERIFAVAYDIVKTSHKLPKFDVSKIIIRGPLRAKGRDLAFGNDSDSDDDFVDSDDEEAEAQPKKIENKNSMIIELDAFPTIEELCEPRETSMSIPSFKLQSI